MKNAYAVLWTLFAAMVFANPVAAVNIDGLPAASSVHGTDLFECEQGGINNKCTGSQLLAFFAGLSPTLPSAPLSQVVGLEVDGVTSARTPVFVLPCVTGTTQQVNQALYFSTPTQTTACSSQISIDDNTLSVGGKGTFNAPDGGTWSSGGLLVNSPLTISYGASFGLAGIPLTVVNTNNVDVGYLQCPTGTCRLTFGTSASNLNSMDFLWNYAGAGSASNALCLQFYGSGTCKWNLDTGGNESVTGKITAGLIGDVNHVTIVLSGCGTDCGFYTNGAGLGMSTGTGAFGSTVFDYGITTASKFTFSVPAILSSGLTSTTMTATAAAPTVAAAQIGYGSTTAATTNCGSLASAVACIVVNIAGTVHYVPYY